MEKNSLTAIIMATMVEAKPFVTGMGLESVSKKPFLVFEKKQYLLVICGIGKANAAMATAYCCTKFRPDTVYNFGAAGALGKSKRRGDIYQINKIIEHDRPDFKNDKPFVHYPATLKGYKNATLSTSDKAAVTAEQRVKVSQYGGELVDMEGASVVQTCKKFKTPCHLFKYVSDTLEDIESSSIINNIREHRQKTFEFFMKNLIL